MRNALLFDDVIQFTDFVRVYGSNATSSKGFTLYYVRDPQRPARTQLILQGFRRRKNWSFSDVPMILEEIQIEERQDGLHVKILGSPRQKLELQGKKRGLSLVELIALLPSREEQNTGKILFWLRNPKLMPRLVTDSFKLGNDRIQFAPIEQDDQTIMLLRIEKPSYYLIQWSLEQHREEIDLFYSPTEDVYIEWGYTHPLEDLWRKSQQPRKAEWLMFRNDAKREHVQPPKWQDIYKAADFVLNFPIEKIWTEASEAKVSFQLPLRFEPRSRPLEPELWMLEEEDQHLLERLLSLVDEVDLKTLLLSVQEGEDQKRRFFIREKHLGEGRKFLDFKGKRFASYKGFHNLLLPVEFELQPQLRRDQYRKLFSLRNGELTVVISKDSQSQSEPTLKETQLLKLKENSFEPITRLIDYIIESDAEVLQNLLKKSIFDFGHYARAPRRSDLLKQRNEGQRDKKEPQEKKKEKIDPVQTKEKVTKKKTVPKKKKIILEKDLETKGDLVVEPTDFEKEEARIERVLVQEGQSAENWQELIKIKHLMKKWGDATTSAFEGLWFLSAGEEYDRERARLTELLDQDLALTGNPAQRIKKALAKAEQKQEPMAVAAYVLHGHDEGEDRITDWLQQATVLLRQTEKSLRKKERWLLWREIFLRNRDNREYARVQEAILNDLNQNGITNHDVPIFIQERLFQERWLLDDEANDSSNEVGAAYRNLELITQTVQSFPLARIREPGLAVLARAYGRIGHHPRAKELLDQTRKEFGKLELDTRAWVELYTYQAVYFQSKGEGDRLKKEYAETCTELGQKNKSHLNQVRKMETSLEDRKELENLSGYLSKENNKRLFPSTTSSASSPIKARLDAIESSFQAGEMDRVGKEVVGVLEHIRGELTKKKKDPDFRTLAWLLDSAINTLSKLKWGNEGRELIREFEDFVSAIPQQPPEKAAKLSDFYFTLLHLAMSEGLIALGSEPYAIQHLQELLAWTFDRDLVPLDYIDMCSKALNTIEAGQLKNRQEPLKLIMQGMHRQLTSPATANSYDNPSFAAITLRLLDQTVEVALSKEKLTLGLYKQYTDQDELLIRERIFTEELFN